MHRIHLRDPRQRDKTLSTHNFPAQQRDGYRNVAGGQVEDEAADADDRFPSLVSLAKSPWFSLSLLVLSTSCFNACSRSSSSCASSRRFIARPFPFPLERNCVFFSLFLKQPQHPDPPREHRSDHLPAGRYSAVLFRPSLPPAPLQLHTPDTGNRARPLQPPP